MRCCGIAWPSGQTVPSPGRVRLGSSKAQTMLEFAIVAPIFLFLMFAVIDFGRMFFLQQDLQNAVDEAGRFASTGNTLPGATGATLTAQRISSILEVAQQAAVGANITSVQISSLAGGAGSPGGPGDTVTISITTSVQLTPIVGRFFPNGAYTFTSSTTFKNEPFPSS